MTKFQKYLRTFCDDAGSVEKGANAAAKQLQVTPRCVLAWLYGHNQRPRDLIAIIENSGGQLSLLDFFDLENESDESLKGVDIA